MWRNNFSEVSCSDSDSLSNDSGSLSHVPINIDNLDIERLTIEDSTMEHIQAQVEQLTNLVQNLVVAQQQQTQKLLSLEHATVAPVVEPSVNLNAFFKIPDPIKLIPIFDGNKKQLYAWLKTAENALNIFKDNVQPAVFRMYEDAVGNKIQGRAKDALCLEGNPTDFQEIKEILLRSFSDRDDLSTHMSQLWHNKMSNSVNLKSYFLRTKELIQKIKMIARNNEKYKNNWTAINSFIDETSLAAFIAGLHNPYFGYVQAARPEDLEQAYAFLCKFRPNETTSEHVVKNPDQKYYGSRSYVGSQTRFNSIHKDREANHPSSSACNYKKVSNVRLTPPGLPEPMEAETSKSNLTLNRQIFNHTEANTSNNNDTENDVTANFCVVTNKMENT